jgi:hypothetical protein
MRAKPISFSILTVVLTAGALFASPAAYADAPTSSSTAAGASSTAASPAVVEPDKGGPAAACGRLSLNARLHSAACNKHLISTKSILDRCAKLAIAAGFVAAGSVAVATTPLDWPGVALTGTFTVAGTEVFCQADWI